MSYSTVNVVYRLIPGSKPEGQDPLPVFRRTKGISRYKTEGYFPEECAKDLGTANRVMPYKLQNRYTRSRKPILQKTIVLENEWLKATFVPSFGGKLWSLYDKENNRELLLNNPVVQPGNLALRDAWTSGGIEWNFGSIGHTYFTSDNVWTAIMMDDEGNRFLRIYEYERAKECVFQADFHLPADSHQLYSHVRCENTSGAANTTYWWTNVAIPNDGTRVLCSQENVIVVCGGKGLTYEKLPYLSVMEGDLSYPDQATRSFDYFFQPETDAKTEWESGVDRNGNAFYDRSTAPLRYHKMFCWGNHRAGQHWQDSLSDPGKGDYVEIQAGFARSQLHDRNFAKDEVIEWTQCFGGMKVDPAKIHGVALHDANVSMGTRIDDAVPEETILAMDKKFESDALIPVQDANIVHAASGWGALEKLREEKFPVGRKLPQQLLFPISSLSDEQDPWLMLLENGTLPEECPDHQPISYMTSPTWMKMLRDSMEKEEGKNWMSLLQYGNMLYEYWDTSDIAANVYDWPDKDQYEKLAEEAWLESVKLCKNAWALRNLAQLEGNRKDFEACQQYYDQVFELEVSRTDFCFAAEYLGWLVKKECFEKAWKLFQSLPREIQENDKVKMVIAPAAVELREFDFLEGIFYHEYVSVREGEANLADVWLRTQAIKMAEKRGIINPSKEVLKELYNEAFDTCPPPIGIDFRMSYDKNNPYRLQTESSM